jgi:hypothetical protein
VVVVVWPVLGQDWLGPSCTISRFVSTCVCVFCVRGGGNTGLAGTLMHSEWVVVFVVVVVG